MSHDRDDAQFSDVAVRLEGLRRLHLSAADRQRIWRTAYSYAQRGPQTSARRQGLTGSFLRLFASSLVVMAFLVTSVVWASTQSLPGDALYPLARGFESAQLALTPAPQRAEVELQLLNRRAMEVRQLIHHQRPVPPEIIIEISTAVEKMITAPESFGGATVVRGHLALQEEMLRRVVAQNPKSRAAAVVVGSTAAARVSLQPLSTLTSSAIFATSSHPAFEPERDQQSIPPGQNQILPDQGETPGESHRLPPQEQMHRVRNKRYPARI